MSERKYQLGRDVELFRETVLDSTGERITESRAREMATYALEHVRRGRPSLGVVRRSPQLSFRLSDELAKRAQALAHAEGKTLSQVAGEALQRYVEGEAGS